jgi:hypothetical protein
MRQRFRANTVEVKIVEILSCVSCVMDGNSTDI